MIRGNEWLIVLLVVVLIFGARKLPDLARSLGSSAKEFRKGIEEGSKEDAAQDSQSDSEASPDSKSDSSEVSDS